MAACTATAVALVWYHIGRDSFWLDEAASLRFVRNTRWADILTASNGNMPLYLGFLKLWVPHAQSEAAVRFLSAVPFVLTVPTIALLGRRMTGNRVGVLAAVAVATHPLLVRYGQEARSFSLVSFLVTAGVLALVVGVQDKEPRSFLAGVALLGIAPYAHAVAALTAALLIAWLLWLPADALPVRRVWALGIFTVIIVPLALLITTAGTESISWTGRGRHGGVVSLLSVVWENASGTLAGLIIGGAASIGVALAVAAIRRKGHTIDGWLAGVSIAWILGTGMLVIVVSLRQSLLVSRYVLLVVPGVALLAASAAVHMRWSRVATLLLVAAALFNIGVIVDRGGAYRPEDWREAQTLVATRARPGDGVVFAPTSKVIPYEYYQVRAAKEFPDPVLPRGRWGRVHVDFAKFTRDRPSDLTAGVDASRHDRMWLIVAIGPGGGPSDSFLAAANDAFASRDRKEGSWTFGDVKVQLYDAR